MYLFIRCFIGSLSFILWMFFDYGGIKNVPYSKVFNVAFVFLLLIYFFFNIVSSLSYNAIGDFLNDNRHIISSEEYIVELMEEKKAKIKISRFKIYVFIKTILLIPIGIILIYFYFHIDSNVIKNLNIKWYEFSIIIFLGFTLYTILFFETIYEIIKGKFVFYNENDYKLDTYLTLSKNNNNDKKIHKKPLYITEEIKEPIKIKKEEYQRFFFVKNISEKYLLDSIKEYSSFSGNENLEKYKLKISKVLNWFIIIVDKKISFYTYHDLVGWVTRLDNVSELPDAIGYAKNKIDSRLSYIFYVDEENSLGDTAIGSFNDGRTFFIDMPMAFEKHGNLTLFEDLDIKMDEIIKKLKASGLDVLTLDSLIYKEHWISLCDV